MTDTAIWTMIAGLAVATYLIRFSFIGLLAGRRLPAVVTEALSFVPVTVLPAIIAPMVLLGRDGHLVADPQRLAAAAAALGVGIATRRMLAAIITGMAAYILLGQTGL
ncbi:AzlD domain-containing protein [Limibaculum sp. M0105]|uniref:AzlD domain-containing protein n=1 Tax=Thermohalobaculum xanthum TaxID=2753746 RepID=A0A8J7M7F1_9RHOB|nr:AzlD domain-containing protein [Thermohalobaculum xanthum]MBK0399262.1 AzlD domain-containing protein [Thermohalobaculum xanthum]